MSTTGMQDESSTVNPDIQEVCEPMKTEAPSPVMPSTGCELSCEPITYAMNAGRQTGPLRLTLNIRRIAEQAAIRQANEYLRRLGAVD